MTPVPKGYIALTLSRDGSTSLLDARGLFVLRASGATRGAEKMPSNCMVGTVVATESYWFVAETFEEVCAKLAAALGEQAPTAPPASEEERRVVEAACKMFGELPSNANRDALWDAVRALKAKRKPEGGA